MGTTTALDFGHVEQEGFILELFGTPGQERFDPILKLLSGDAFGVVLVVDSTNPKSFIRAKTMLEKTKTTGLPIVVAANKSNLDGAYEPDKIRFSMNLNKDIPIVPIRADDSYTIKKGEPCKLNKQDVKTILSKLS